VNKDPPKPKMTSKNSQFKNVMFLKAGYSLWKAGGISWCMEILHRGIRRNILHFCIKNKLDLHFPIFCHKDPSMHPGSKAKR
jgi:hypothetical protein